MTDLAMLRIGEAAKQLRQGALSPLDLVDACLQRIAARKDLNAFVTVLEESARAAARAAETRLRHGDAGSLCGVPFALKDLYYTKGVATTAGSALLANFRPDHDATITERLATAGGVLVGKTTTHEWAFGPTGDAAHNGPSRNPWNPERISGGSSGGSAAAVAAGMCFAAMGTDTGGSVRIPAALCGVVGFKPSYGLASLYGIIPLSFTLDHPGPLTRSVMDAALVMDAVTGFDPLDPCPARRQGGPTAFADALERVDGLAGVTVGVPEDDYFFAITDPAVETCFREAVGRLEKLGARLVAMRTPRPELLMPVSSTIMGAEAAWLHRERLMKNSDAYSPVVRERLEAGARYSGVDYIDSLNKRQSLIAAWDEAMAKIDAVVTPTTPVTATRIGEKTVKTKAGEESVVTVLTRHTRPANITGCPALSVPCGMAGGLPVGLQIMGRRNGDAGVLAVGHAYEKRYPFPLPGR